MFLLSCLQGVGELLPISSSVNLYLFSKFFNFNCPSSLSVGLHLGSLITFLIYFRSDIVVIFKGMFSKRIALKDTYFYPLVIGTIPVVFGTIISGSFLEDFYSTRIMGISCIVFGLLLLFFDKFSITRSSSSKKGIPTWKAFVIGCFQSLAVLPGVSRLGVCLTASRMLSLDRRNSIHFSMLLAIPSILGAMVRLVYRRHNALDYDLFSTSTLWGVLSVAVIGLIFIRPVVIFLERKGFLIVVCYRIIIGTILCFF
ncbi:MAG: hypothetical protein LBE97_00760 [Holosporales bacterium]|nr:hypothetical protein [Holosporales bacterium]